MSQKTFFVTGIGTDVGKTIAAAILTEALESDYWKPVQAGDLDNSDTHKVRRYVTNKKTIFHPNSFALNTPMSPHGAAKIDGLNITLDLISRPKTKNHLVIEGAGGLLVPLNNKDTVMDLIQPKDHVIVVSRHYLGSINHTLMTLKLLKNEGFNVSLIYSGDKHDSTESIIDTMTKTPVIGRIENEPYIDQNVIKEYAQHFKPNLL
ncbi:dethiobiotin synthase [Winogradskyella aurantiaca]|uniref:dethiobiotin synthase n=1 Tax=Winogradskyella aurantiaca TaxID=2219558 RepID=UPI000E1D8ED4|nr:dethiobiotin synthase [Winogradskyella aurantiaca]